jgi:hypothetical protein
VTVYCGAFSGDGTIELFALRGCDEKPGGGAEKVEGL